MAPLGTIKVLAFIVSTALARPHRVSTGTASQVRAVSTAATAAPPSGTVHSGPVPSGTIVKASSKAAEHTYTTKSAGGDLLGSLLGGLSGLNDKVVDDADCSTAVTVTTQVQVTVTVTNSDYTAEETGAPQDAAVETTQSSTEPEQAYTTQIAEFSKASRHRHQHGTSVSGTKPASSASASVKPASSSLKPSSAVSSSLVPSLPASSLAAVPSSTTEATTLPSETYVAPTILPELPSAVVPVSSLAAVATSTTSSTTSAAPATVYSSVEDKGHIPSFSIPPIPTTVIPPATTAWPTTTSSTSTSSTSTSSTSTVQAAAPSSYSGKGKRGLAYNDASLTKLFASSSQISWAYNWASSTSGLASGIMYIPTLWGNSASFTNSWKSNAQKAIASGSTHLFSFNEPDLSSQSNMSPDTAAAAYKTYMSDMFGGGSTKLCAPAVTNGGGATGLNWLKSFMSACTSCQIDCINIHWYGTSASDFEQHVKDTIAVAGGKEIWVSEFGVTGSPASSTVQSFLDSTMSFLDDTDEVAGYAYFMASQGILVDGSSASSPVGTTYMG